MRVTIRLTDEIGYWDPPPADGDLLFQITWRGMGSNRSVWASDKWAAT